MLSLYVGYIEDEVWNHESYFDGWFDYANLMTEFSKRIVLEIDQSRVVSQRYIDSPVLGAITPKDLSGGVKLLLLLMYNDIVSEYDYLGENCYRALGEIAIQKDITLCITQSCPDLFELSGLKEVKLVNTGVVYTDNISLNDAIRDIVYSRKEEV